MGHDTVGWVTLTKSGPAVSVPCKVWGIIVTPGAATEQCVIYDALDANSGRVFHKLFAGTQQTLPLLFIKPVHFDVGVYVDFTGNIDEVTILYEPAT